MGIEKEFYKFLKDNNYKISLSLGEFTLETQALGKGGNGVVYEARILGKIVAIKFLITEVTGHTKQKKVERFLAEYFNIITINDNSNIVRYIDYDILQISGEDGKITIPVIIMQKYDTSLAITQETPNEKGFINLLNFLLNTVEKIHREGIIHRDIKPENILINGDGFVLADFGIASYNPEIFHIRSETDKKERLGNRLFSAPEQEESGIKPHPTMDIYALGQVLQCYVTGKTHRGTGREQISKKFIGLNAYEDIIEKCLENSPSNRFQSIGEIREFIQRRKKKYPFSYLQVFNQICIKNFPKNEYKVIHSDKIDKIDGLLNSLKEKEEYFGNTLWWHDGSANFEFNLKQSRNGVWKFGNDEYKIKEIWVHYDNSMYNDFILVHYIPNEPFLINGEEKTYAVIVDGQHYISYSEYENGYAEINNEVVKLSPDKVEFIDRKMEEGYFFICNKYHCVLQMDNDEIVREFIERILRTPIADIKVINEFARKTKAKKNPEILMRL